MALITINFQSLRSEEQGRLTEQVRQELKEEGGTEPTKEEIDDFINRNNLGQTFSIGEK